MGGVARSPCRRGRLKALSWAERAQADLARIGSFYGNLDSDFVQRALREALRAGEFLCEFPEAGPTTRHRGLRKWRVKSTPFLLLYRIVRDEVRITRVVHDAQNDDRW